VAKRFEVSPLNCVVLEDSVTGMLSAKSASMETIVIPEDKKDPRFSLANIILSFMLDIIPYVEKK
jgi:beta-phosphoglucomutase-like phosphatase (HAD superfamily)